MGHLSNEAAGETLVKLFQMKMIGRAFLGHLSQVNNTPKIAFLTVASMLKKRGIEAKVGMALRNVESELIEI